MFRELVLTEMIFDLRIFNTKPVIWSLDYEECRTTLLLFTRVQSSINKRILNTNHPGLIFQLEFFKLRRTKDYKARQVQNQSSYWDWWSPRTCTDSLERTINTCEELDNLSSYQDQKYHKLRLLRICLGRTLFCQTPDYVFRLGVVFVLPLSQEEK